MKHCLTISISLFAIFVCIPVQAHFGNHTLVATATHPWNGATNYSVKSTNTFTAQANSTVDVGFDGMGNVTSRSLTGGKTQTLTWDGLGRLVKVAQRDSGNSGYDWTALYDGLGRRLMTVQTVVVGGVYSTNAETIESYYDPEVEFQEVGVSYNGRREWKLYGPDLNGVYGGLMGIGGLETVVRESDGQTTAVLNNYFGDVVATVSGGAVKWGTTQFASSGPVLGYEPPRLSYNIPLAEALGRWGKRQDGTGFYYYGARYLHEGRFLSADPMGFGGSTWDLYGYANGDMLNGYDADGRFGKGAVNAGIDMASGAGRLLYNTGGTIGYGLTSLFSPEMAESIYGQQREQFVGAGQNLGQLLYDTGGTIGLGLTGDYDTYGDQFNRLSDVAYALSGGGEGNSSAYRIGYTGATIGSLFLGGEIGTAGRTSQMADVGGQAAMRSRILANIAESQAARSASRFEQFEARVTARDFFDRIGMSPTEASQHMTGIDFTRPVEAVTVPAGTQVMQWMFPKGGVGNYFAPIGSTPGEIGIHGFGRVPVTFQSQFDVEMLQSTAAPILDTWSVRGMVYPVEGGGTQLFNPRPDLFRRF